MSAASAAARPSGSADAAQRDWEALSAAAPQLAATSAAT